MAAGKPQRVIIAAQSLDHSAKLAGVPFKRFFRDARVFAETQLLVSEYYGFDAPNNTWDVYNIEAEALGQKIKFYADAIPDVDRTHPLIGSPADLDEIKIPDPYTSGRMPWVHAINKAYMELIGRPARVCFCAPFSLAANIRGYENLMMDIYSNPDFAHRLFEFLCDEVLEPYILAMRREIGQPNALAQGNDAWASPPMITLEIMDEFVIRYTQRLREKVGGKLVTLGNWGDSRSSDPEFPEKFMALKLKASPGFLSVLDPDLYAIGPRRVKAFAESHDAHVTAGVDAALLEHGPVAAIEDRIKQYIDAMARDGRCVIYLNQISANTPPVHIHAAVAACRAYGQFPIAENLDAVTVGHHERESFSDFLREKGVVLSV
jgi:uroporphyrinogen-III decarboxylase